LRSGTLASAGCLSFSHCKINNLAASATIHATMPLRYKGV
jgi:hypothetical protein